MNNLVEGCDANVIPFLAAPKNIPKVWMSHKTWFARVKRPFLYPVAESIPFHTLVVSVIQCDRQSLADIKSALNEPEIANTIVYTLVSNAMESESCLRCTGHTVAASRGSALPSVSPCFIITSGILLARVFKQPLRFRASEVGIVKVLVDVVMQSFDAVQTVKHRHRGPISRAILEFDQRVVMRKLVHVRSLKTHVLDCSLLAKIYSRGVERLDLLPIRSSQALSSSGRGGPLKFVGLLGLSEPSPW